MSLRFISLFLAMLVAGCGSTAGTPSILRDVDCVRDAEIPAPDIWEASIEGYEASDEVIPPAPDSIVFVGSSSILFWNTLDQDMSPMPVLNRGFGGSVIEHVTHFSDRIVLPYEPSAIVLYAGDNDIAYLLSADCVLRDFEAFVAHIHEAAPGTPIYFISFKPSPSRMGLWADMDRANQLIEARTTIDATLHFIDVSQAMFDEHDEPRGELYLEDGLHMTGAGYELWTSIVRPRLGADLGF